MARRPFDRQAEAAESALDRLDDGRDAGAGDDLEDTPSVVIDGADLDGLHLDDGADPADDLDDLDSLLGPEVDGEMANVVDAFADAFNARDLDELVTLVTDDCETPGLAGGIDDFAAAIDDLWQRRPGAVLTRAQLDDQCLGVLWELEGAAWWRIATVHLADCVDGQVGVIVFSDDPVLLDEIAATPPDLDLDQGSRWEEWDEGA